MRADVPVARDWWSWFKRAVKEAYSTDDSQLTRCWGRVKERPEKEDYSKEWTAVMSVFLAGLAQEKGFHQKWEKEKPTKKGYGHIDFVWYKRVDNQKEPLSHQPSVLIEHEQQRYGEKKKGLKWVARKLVKSNKQMVPPPLRVLITYRWTQSYQDDKLKDLVSKGLRRRREVPFLLVIGAEDNEDPEEWHGYIWRGPRSGFGDMLRFRVRDQMELSQKGSETPTPKAPPPK